MKLLPSHDTKSISISPFALDIEIPMHADIFSSVINYFSFEIPSVTINYVNLTKQLRCTSSMIHSLDENYVGWLILNIDLLFLANVGLLRLFEKISHLKSIDSANLIQKEIRTI